MAKAATAKESARGSAWDRTMLAWDAMSEVKHQADALLAYIDAQDEGGPIALVSRGVLARVRELAIASQELIDLDEPVADREKMKQFIDGTLSYRPTHHG